MQSRRRPLRRFEHRAANVHASFEGVRCTLASSVMAPCSGSTGELGLGTQTSPDQFTDQVLGSGTNPQRLHTADVDGDGLEDVVGASPFVFVYSTKQHALVQLAKKARS